MSPAASSSIRIRVLNDAVRSAGPAGPGQWVLTAGISEEGPDFAILAMRAVQAFDGFRAQQAEFSTAQIHASDPLVRVEMSKRVRDIDAELGRIRADAMLLYGRMTEVILLLGGSTLDLGAELSGPLALPIRASEAG